jgi:glucan phosphoethanolaminetransferase (alkaline phosphatase superfamily)
MTARNKVGIILFSVCLLAVFVYLGLLSHNSGCLASFWDLAVFLTVALGIPISLLVMKGLFLRKAVFVFCAAALIFIFAALLPRFIGIVPEHKEVVHHGHHHEGYSDTDFIVSLFLLWFIAVTFIYFIIGVIQRFCSNSVEVRGIIKNCAERKKKECCRPHTF